MTDDDIPKDCRAAQPVWVDIIGEWMVDVYALDPQARIPHMTCSFPTEVEAHAFAAKVNGCLQ